MLSIVHPWKKIFILECSLEKENVTAKLIPKHTLKNVCTNTTKEILRVTIFLLIELESSTKWIYIGWQVCPCITVDKKIYRKGFYPLKFLSDVVCIYFLGKMMIQSVRMYSFYRFLWRFVFFWRLIKYGTNRHVFLAWIHRKHMHITVRTEHMHLVFYRAVF